MTKLANWILNHKKHVLALTLIILALSLILMMMVKINYSLTDYLPDDAPSTAALKVMKQSFDNGIPNLDIFVPVKSIPEALEYKDKIASVTGVSDVMWLDDITDVTVPLEMLDKDLVSAWFNSDGALFKATVDTDKSVQVTESLRDIIGPNGALNGEVANFSYIQTVTMSEVAKIMVYVVPLVLVVLLISTSSWLEPFLFLIVIGIAILINQGTNIFIGEISYVTQACSAILQLAVSMDYAIFLLHSFARHREVTDDVSTAMRLAIVESTPAIAASMLTTLFGFLSLCLMRFKLGPDMGIVLAKGVVCSYIAVVLVMPVLAVSTTKLMDKTRHRSLIPNFNGFSRLVVRICVPMIIIVAILVVPSYLAQSRNEFVYGSSGMRGDDSSVKQENDYIEATFGVNQQMVLLVAEGDVVSETALCEDLKKIPAVTSVTSYATEVGAEIPVDMLSESQISQLSQGGYSRIIIYSATEPEGDETFKVVENIRNTAENYYGSSYYLLGQSVVNSDMKDTVTGDNLIITIASIVSIGIVLLFTFKSLSIPVILILTIETAIWINLSIPYFSGSKLNFIGYQIISSVQLGATVDYGILLTQHFLTKRRTLDKRQAIIEAISVSAPSVLTPALIIFIACKMLGLFSTNGVISELGSILGRGALISVSMVLLFLPALFMIFDGIIQKTTLKRRKNEANKDPTEE